MSKSGSKKSSNSIIEVNPVITISNTEDRIPNTELFPGSNPGGAINN